MKLFFAVFTSLFFVVIDVFAEGNCKDAKGDIGQFINNAVGGVLSISKSRIAPSEQDARLKHLISNCIGIEKLSKRVLGRAKWQEMTVEEQQGFLQEYAVYFINVFKESVFKAVEGMQSFNYTKAGIEDEYKVIFIPSDASKAKLEVVLRIEQNKEGSFEITDGKFAEVSLVTSQKQMFDRLYDEDSNIIKNFKAENFKN